METDSDKACRFHASWKLNRRRRISGCASRGAKEQKPKPPFYTVLKYMGPTVLTLVTVRYQGKTEGLFEKNPVPTWCFLVNTCVYSLVGVVEQIQTLRGKWSQIFRRVALASAVLSIVSLISIFLPYPMSIVPLTICAALQPVIFAWPTLYHAYTLIHIGIKSVLTNIRAKVIWSKRCNLKEEVRLPA